MYNQNYQPFDSSKDLNYPKELIKQLTRDIRKTNIDFNMKVPFGHSTFQTDFQPYQMSNDSANEQKKIKEMLQKSSIRMGKEHLPDQFESTH